jgi:DNA (cytosine-5)-methyltransferase 1
MQFISFYTDPYLNLFRRFIPPLGMIDISPIIAFFALGFIEQAVKSKDTIYQWRRQYVRENKSNACPTLTANMGSGGHNVPLVKDDFGIRKLTPRETANFQGFPKTFKLPKLANSKLYHQFGNSVTVPLISKIAKQIVKVL